MVRELQVRGWRVRDEGPGLVLFFDPSVEHVKLFEGPAAQLLQYEVREGREASEAGARPIDQSRIPHDQLHFAWED